MKSCCLFGEQHVHFKPLVKWCALLRNHHQSPFLLKGPMQTKALFLAGNLSSTPGPRRGRGVLEHGRSGNVEDHLGSSGTASDRTVQPAGLLIKKASGSELPRQVEPSRKLLESQRVSESRSLHSLSPFTGLGLPGCERFPPTPQGGCREASGRLPRRRAPELQGSPFIYEAHILEIPLGRMRVPKREASSMKPDSHALEISKPRVAPPALPRLRPLWLQRGSSRHLALASGATLHNFMRVLDLGPGPHVMSFLRSLLNWEASCMWDTHVRMCICTHKTKKCIDR